jgi:hypothetical protein
MTLKLKPEDFEMFLKRRGGLAGIKEAKKLFRKWKGKAKALAQGGSGEEE